SAAAPACFSFRIAQPVAAVWPQIDIYRADRRAGPDIGKQHEQCRMTLDLAVAVAPRMTLCEAQHATFWINEAQTARKQIGLRNRAFDRHGRAPRRAPEITLLDRLRISRRQSAQRRFSAIPVNPEPLPGPSKRARHVELQRVPDEIERVTFLAGAE